MEFDGNMGHQCPPYCDCDFPSCVKLAFFKGHIPDLCKCQCGEDAVNGAPIIQWGWSLATHGSLLATDARVNYRDIVFHPFYSQGTAIVRGEKPLKANAVHFWEIRILTALGGTDMMFGIGTDKMNLHEYAYHFTSPLGLTDQSWGLSQSGYIQHNGETRQYSRKLSQGCLLGLYVDRSRGIMKYFLNRRPLGVAFVDIPNDPDLVLYPMVSSTCAKSSVRLVNSHSEVDCLQLRAFEVISTQADKLQAIRRMPGFRLLMNSYWFYAAHGRYAQYTCDSDLDIVDEAVLPSKRRRRTQRKKYNHDINVDINDIYADLDNLPAYSSGSEEEYKAADFVEMFDEYFERLS